jgi:cobalamin synthase
MNMEELMTQVLTFATVIGVIIGAFMEMIKRATEIPAKYVPIVAFVVGLLVGAVAYPFTPMDLVLRLWAGGIAGWMASGIYETAKQVKKL